MKRVLFLTGIYLLPQSTIRAQEAGIRFWEGTWQQALDSAEKINELIFLDCYTNWCIPCNYLAKSIFTKQEMGSFFNGRFINVKMDMEKEPGKTLARKYEVTAYPTLLFVNAKGYVVDRMLGVKNPDTLLTWPIEVLKKATVPTPQQLFDAGERSDSFIADYCNTFIKAGKPAVVTAVLQQLMQEQGDTVLYKPVCFRLLPVVAVDSRAALFLVNHQQRFRQLYGAEEVNAMLADMYTAPVCLTALYQHGPPRHFLPEAHAALLQKIKERKVPCAGYLEAKINFYIHCRNSNMPQAWQTGSSLLQNAKGWQYYQMAVLANKYLRNEYRPRAARWAEQAALMAKDTILEIDCIQVARELLTLPFIPLDPATI